MCGKGRLGCSLATFKSRSELVGLPLVLASRRPAAPFHRSHPGRRSAPAFSAASREAVQGHNGLFKILSFRPKLSEHFFDVHYFQDTEPRTVMARLDLSFAFTIWLCA